MENTEILAQIKQEYNLWFMYVSPLRQLYRDRIFKWRPQNRKDTKININMIANAIDTKIASSRSNWLKVKFISSVWRIGEEEAENLTRVAEFDEKETARQQVRYQLEQDSWFFGVWILNKTGWNDTKSVNTWRAINPLSWIPDPLPSQTGQFDWQNYRFHGFTMRTNVFDMVKKYDNNNLNNFFARQYSVEQQKDKNVYSNRAWLWPVTCDTLHNNFAVDIYTHYTIIDGRKYKIVTDWAFWHIFSKEELKAVLKEEKLDPKLIPRPIMLNYTDPMRESPFGNSICDKLEDKQNATSILFNLNVIKAKKEALGGDFLVNSRLIKNRDVLKKQAIEPRYIEIDEDTIGDLPLQNAMFELPQSQIKSDTFAMMNALQEQANRDVKIDSMQSWIVPDKTMTKAEAQTIQGNANAIIRTNDSIKQWFYESMYFQRWRGYQEHFKVWQKKFAILSADFEWKGTTFTKDQFIGVQIPYIMIGSEDEINAVTESRKEYLNLLAPQIKADPSIPEVSKLIFQRLVHKVNWIQPNVINIITPYTASEEKAKEYIDIINLWLTPKSIFDNPNADFFTYYLYIQKAQDWPIKDKVLTILSRYLMENQQPTQAMWNNQIANSAANIAMSQNQPKQQAIDRTSLQPNQA